MTDFVRDPGDDELDGFEIWRNRFGSHPSIVFHGGTLTDDDRYDIDRETLASETGTKILADTKAAVGLVVEQMCTLEIKHTEVKWYINARSGVCSAYIATGNTQDQIVIVIQHMVGKNGKAINVYANTLTYKVEALIAWVDTAFPQEAKRKQDVIKIITQCGNDYDMTSINLEDEQHEFDTDNYNNDFIPVADRIVADLNVKNKSGLVLLHGVPGTGKTSFLKWLLRAVSEKQIIYVPPEMTEHLASPSFMTFLIARARNSILLIEDAENVLLERVEGGSQAVSNILNISDGILGNVLKMQLVCTFNRDLTEIDKALRRPGRLIAEYEFCALTSDKTEKLMKKLYGDSVVCTKPRMTLAEIYNFERMPEKNNLNAKKFVGFAQTDTE